MRNAVCLAILALTACGRPATPPAPAPPQIARVQAGTTRYLIVEQRHVAQEFRGQPIVTDATTRLTLALAVESGEAGFLVEAVVEAAEVEGDAGFSADVVRSAVGARFLAHLSPGGTMLELTAPTSSSPLLEQLALDLHDLVPRLPPQGAPSGAIWHDTTSISARTAGIPITLVLRATHQAGSWTAGDGESTLPVTTQTDYTLTGEGERSGQWITMSGTGTSRHHRLVTANGAVALGVRSDTLHMEIELPGAGLVIPLTQIRTDTVRRVNR